MSVSDKLATIKDNVPKVYEAGKEAGYDAGYREGVNQSPEGIKDAVRYTEQTLTEEQKAQARENIGAMSDVLSPDGTIKSPAADFAEVGEWLDGNPNNEDRRGYFVCIDPDVPGPLIRKARSTDDVRGAIMGIPGFAGNCTADKFDEEDNLLPQYDYVGVMGLIPVIDNGTCTINGRCMPADDGTAIPSSNNLGYHVVDRIDDRTVLVVIEPSADMIQRVKEKTKAFVAKADVLSVISYDHFMETEKPVNTAAVIDYVFSQLEKYLPRNEITRPFAEGEVMAQNIYYQFDPLGVCVTIAEQFDKISADMGDIGNALDELHNYAQSLIGGAE